MSEDNSPALPIPMWADKAAACDYQAWDDASCWLLGYPFLPHELELDGDGSGNRLLDLGCGPGTVARWIACTYGIQVVAVDASPAMLALAAALPGDRVSYHLSVADRMPFLTEASIDAAMACFVFNSISDGDRVQGLVGEVARVLRPGGRFTILAPHPDHVDGACFEGFRRGEAGVGYQAGDPVLLRVRRHDGTWASVVNVYWPAAAYHAWLYRAGFTTIRHRAPILADADGVADPHLLTAREWTLERSRPPFLLITAERAADDR